MSSNTRARRLGRYLLCGEIASGGMATVCFGRLMGPVGFSRTVALKRLHAAYAKDPEFVAMFMDEARLASRVRHPNVVQVLDVVNEDEELVLVMDYVQGAPLSRLLSQARRDGQPPPPAVASAIVSDALRGLHAAHEAQSETGAPLALVHRDISPQNILVHEDGMALVTDFGIAHAVGRAQTTREGQLKGKPGYMAPEQILCEEITRRTDLFAAGVVLWEALTGHRLFQADNDIAVSRKVLSGRVDPPSRVRPGLPREVDSVVLRALALEPGVRFETAAEMQQALERALPGAPASAVSAWVRALCGDVLAERAQQIRQMEGEPAEPARSKMPASTVPLPTLVRSSSASPEATSALLAMSAPPAMAAPSTSVALTSASPPPTGETAANLTSAALGAAAPKRRALGWAALLGALVVVLLVVLVAQNARAPSGAAEPEPRPTAAAAPPEPEKTAPEPAPAPTPAPAASAAPAVAAPVATPRAAPAATTAPPRATAPRSTPAPAADCNPPYVVDARGIKVFKKQCLR